MAHFEDPETGKKVLVAQYKTIEGDPRFYDRWGNELVNKNGKALIFVPNEEVPLFNMGKFTMMSREDQRKSLRKRALEHSKRTNSEEFHERNRKEGFEN